MLDGETECSSVSSWVVLCDCLAYNSSLGSGESTLTDSESAMLLALECKITVAESEAADSCS